MTKAESSEWAAEVGVAAGYGDGTFRPGLALHRDHAALFMKRYYDDVLEATPSPALTWAYMLLPYATDSGNTDEAVASGCRGSDSLIEMLVDG